MACGDRSISAEDCYHQQQTNRPSSSSSPSLPVMYPTNFSSVMMSTRPGSLPVSTVAEAGDAAVNSAVQHTAKVLLSFTPAVAQ